MNSFSDLSLCAILQGNLKKNLFETPTAVQAGAIPPALAGRDVVATAQTGTGKTLAFVLPMVERLMSQAPSKGVEAVVLSPTRELAMQIHQCFQMLAEGAGVTSALVVGGLNEDRQLMQIRRGARVLIATPGRLCDFLQRRLVKLTGTRIVVLDEADRMLDMGFLPDLTRILETMPETKQTLLFSATLEKSVAHLVDQYVKDAARVAIGTTKPASEVDLHVYEVEQDRKLGLLAGLLEQQDGSTLVFARTKHGADKLAKRLAEYGVRAARIHGDRTQSQRNQALDGFKRGDYRVLVATDVAARGIHVDGIAHVVNYDLPQVPEDFVHRVGRTGRAGAKGVASTFSTRAERGSIKRIERTLKVRLEVQSSEVPEPEKKPIAFVAARAEMRPAMRAKRPETRHWEELIEEREPVVVEAPKPFKTKSAETSSKPYRPKPNGFSAGPRKWNEERAEKPFRPKPNGFAAGPRQWSEERAEKPFRPKTNGFAAGPKQWGEERAEKPFRPKTGGFAAAGPKKWGEKSFQPKSNGFGGGAARPWTENGPKVKKAQGEGGERREWGAKGLFTGKPKATGAKSGYGPKPAGARFAGNKGGFAAKGEGRGRVAVSR